MSYVSEIAIYLLESQKLRAAFRRHNDIVNSNQLDEQMIFNEADSNRFEDEHHRLLERLVQHAENDDAPRFARAHKAALTWIVKLAVIAKDLYEAKNIPLPTHLGNLGGNCEFYLSNLPPLPETNKQRVIPDISVLSPCDETVTGTNRTPKQAPNLLQVPVNKYGRQRQPPNVKSLESFLLQPPTLSHDQTIVQSGLGPQRAPQTPPAACSPRPRSAGRQPHNRSMMVPSTGNRSQCRSSPRPTSAQRSMAPPLNRSVRPRTANGGQSGVVCPPAASASPSASASALASASRFSQPSGVASASSLGSRSVAGMQCQQCGSTNVVQLESSASFAGSLPPNPLHESWREFLTQILDHVQRVNERLRDDAARRPTAAGAAAGAERHAQNCAAICQRFECWQAGAQHRLEAVLRSDGADATKIGAVVFAQLQQLERDGGLVCSGAAGDPDGAIVRMRVLTLPQGVTAEAVTAAGGGGDGAAAAPASVAA